MAGRPQSTSAPHAPEAHQHARHDLLAGTGTGNQPLRHAIQMLPQVNMCFTHPECDYCCLCSTLYTNYFFLPNKYRVVGQTCRVRVVNVAGPRDSYTSNTETCPGLNLLFTGRLLIMDFKEILLPANSSHLPYMCALCVAVVKC